MDLVCRLADSKETGVDMLNFYKGLFAVAAMNVLGIVLAYARTPDQLQVEDVLMANVFFLIVATVLIVRVRFFQDAEPNKRVKQ